MLLSDTFFSLYNDFYALSGKLLEFIRDIIIRIFKILLIFFS